MYVLFLVLNKTQYLEEVLISLKKAGVKGATILDSQGMGSTIVAAEMTNVPLFAALRSSFDRDHPYNKTVFTVVDSEELLLKAMEAIKSVVGELDKPNEGLMFALPISHVAGINQK